MITWLSVAITGFSCLLAQTSAPGNAPTPQPAPAPPTAPAATSPKPPPAKPDYPEPAIVMRILELGTEPRVLPRLPAGPNVRQSLVVSAAINDLNETDESAPPPIRVEPLPVAMILNTESTKTDSGFSRKLAVVAADVLAPSPYDPEYTVRVERRMVGLTELQITSTLDAAGMPASTELTMPKNVNPLMVRNIDALRYALRLMAPLRPAQPVGVGARWEVKTILPSNQVPLEATIVYTVTAIDDRGMTVSLEAQTTIEPRRLEPVYGMTAEGKLDVLRAGGTVRGSLSLQWDLPLPVAGVLDDESLFDVSILPRDVATRYKQRTLLKVRVSDPSHVPGAPR